MNFATQFVARFEVALFSGSGIVTGKLRIGPGPLQKRQGFAGDKSELRVETERAIVVTRLYEADPYGLLCCCPIDYGTHQAFADGAILRLGRDRDRAKPKNNRALVHE